MGNLCVSNEPSIEDKLRDQLCRIVLEYEKLELECGYIALFQMLVASRPLSPDLQAVTPTHGNSTHYGTAQTIVANSNGLDHSHHHHNSSTRSNLKVKEKKEIQKIIDLDYEQFNQWKIDEIMQKNPNITEQELRDNHGLSLSSSSNYIFPPFASMNVSKFGGNSDEKEKLLQQQRQHKGNSPNSTGSDYESLNERNGIHQIKRTLQNNDIKASVQSLGDTTDQLFEILDRAKIIHKMRNTQNNKIIHVRGNKQSIFSYYLILNTHIIISFAQSKSVPLEFLEWIKIQSKLEKLEVTLKDIEALLGEQKSE